MDDLQRCGLYAIQKPGSFLFGTDSVLLAHFAKTKRSASVIDLGTGSGVLALLVWGRYRPQHICGIEIQPEFADMAQRNVQLNGLEESIQIIQGDYTQHDHIPRRGQYDVAIANPPYIKEGAGARNTDETNARARQELAGTLGDVIHAASVCLRNGGKFYMVHQPARLSEIFVQMTNWRIEPKEVQLVQPHPDKQPKLVLVKGVKDARPGIHFLPNLVIYGPDGSYSRDMQEIYDGE